MKSVFLGEDSIFNLHVSKESWEDIKLYKEEYKWVIHQRESNDIPFSHRSPQRHYRKYILEYLKRIAGNKQLTYCTLHLTVYILDIFMDNHSIATERVLLVANVCLLIASKVEENNLTIPKICELNEAIDNRFPPHDYKALELLVLQFFHWYMMFPTAAHYVYYFLHVALNLDDLRNNAGESQDTLYRRMQPIVRHYLDKIIDDVHYMQFYKPSKLASAVISIARSAVGLRAWTEQLFVLTSYNDEEIDDARMALLDSGPLMCKFCVNKFGYYYYGFVILPRSYKEIFRV